MKNSKTQNACLRRQAKRKTLNAKRKAKSTSLFSSAHCLVPNAFTLIELLVVITIIGILSTLGLVSFGEAQKRARDAQRKSDLRQIQTALRAYYNENGGYPDRSGAGTAATDYQIKGCGPVDARTACEWGRSWVTGEGRTYMARIPKDPKTDRQYSYNRESLDSYHLVACLENANDISPGVMAAISAYCSSVKMYLVRQ